MDLSVWVFFAMAILVASVSPGPNVLIVVMNSARFGRYGAVWTILGNLTCLFFIAALASVGVGAALATAPVAYLIMKIAGGVYLAWVGIKLIKTSFGQMASAGVIETTVVGERPSRKELFLQAFVISASNPKSILFLTAVFPQFLNVEAAIVPQFAVMFATIIGLVSFIHGVYAFAAVSLRERPLGQRVRRWLARVTGATFIGLGAGVAFAK